MSLAYPPGPAALPPNLTAPSAAYKRHAWLAMLGLTVFIALYFALSAWFAWTAWRLLGGMFGANGNFDLWGFVAGVCAAFLAVFMLKALFFIQHRGTIEDIEITRAEEPELFEFIDRLADEAHAPRAHKVYLSPHVNASVFYDLSLLNLVIPSKKNLMIGLGLVNAVSFGELKAVLAHEFGHFAQRSMAVGRWVYIAEQISRHVVQRRDALDKLLAQLSRFDLRVAWVGWLLSIIVWSIRSVMEVVFRLVMLAERALSRQMEFQADLVAVSLTGSDALVHALHRLKAADDAWDKTLSFTNAELAKKRGITDLFAVQSRIIERVREILNQPHYGAVPPMPANAPEAHRVFKSELAQPPRMWSTHPPSADREHNAKQRYVAAAVDQRSAWELFRDPESMKERMSAHVQRNAEVQPTPLSTTLEQLEKFYGRAYLDRRYQGTYLNRSPVRYVRTAGELYGPPPAGEALLAALASLYPANLADEMEQLNEKLEQKYALEALRDQVAQAPGGVIRHNGEELRRADLPRAIAVLEREIAGVRASIETHDKRCRSAHLGAANTLQKGWPEYLQGLAAVLHYADHTEANLRDVNGYVINIYNIVTADGRVSSAELTRLVGGCQELYSSLGDVFRQASTVMLDRTLLRRLEVENWPAMLEEFKLQPPNRENISNWLGVIDGWMAVAFHALSALRDAALEQLLLAEGQVAKFVRDHLAPADAPPPSSVPREYRTLLPGAERPRQKRLDWWDRFQTADGVVPAIARSSVALGIVGGVIALGANFGVSTVTIFNALTLPVTIEIGDGGATVRPGRVVTVDIPQSGKLSVRALSADGDVIESFEEELTGANAKYVYNVAGAVPLFEWTATYTEHPGSQRQPAERYKGAVRWSVTHVDHVFEEPPEHIQIDRNSAGYREVLSAYSQLSPYSQSQLVKDPAERSRLILAHARWDGTDSENIFQWLSLAEELAEFDALFEARLKQDPSNVLLLRFRQDHASAEEHEKVCARQRADSASAPQDPDLQYLGIRCLEDENQKNREFLAAFDKWPDNPWLAMAVASTHAEAGNFAAAEPLYEKAYKELPPLRGFLVLDAARVRRLSAAGSDVPLGDLAKHSQQIAMFEAIESGRDVTGSGLEPYSALARGELQQALKLAKKSGVDNDAIVWLAAASDGANQEMIERALALPVGESADLASMFAMYGIAVREGHDPAPYANRIHTEFGRQGDAVLAFLEAVRRGADPAAGRNAMPMMDLRSRLFAQNAVLIMRGPRTPRGWREQVTRGLFIGERQYLARTREAPEKEVPRQAAPSGSPGTRPARILSSPVG